MINLYETAVCAKDDIQYIMKKVWIFNYAFWIYQHLNNFSNDDELSIDLLQQLILFNLFEWHFNFFTYNWKTFKKFKESIDSAEKA